jgi:hypothetical protein
MSTTKHVERSMWFGSCIDAFALLQRTLSRPLLFAQGTKRFPTSLSATMARIKTNIGLYDNPASVDMCSIFCNPVVTTPDSQ